MPPFSHDLFVTRVSLVPVSGKLSAFTPPTLAAASHARAAASAELCRPQLTHLRGAMRQQRAVHGRGAQGAHRRCV